MHVRLFNIIYSTTFSLLSFILLILLFVTPADSIRQAFNNRHFYNLAAIAGTYLLTAVLALLIYSSRLYTNRSVLAAIPKAWVPVEKGDVGSSVGRMIEEGLSESAVVARDARPRNLSAERGGEGEERERRESGGSASVVRDGGGTALLDHQRTDHERQEAAVTVTTVTVPPIWGHVAHPGYSSPSSPDLSNLHYLTVILELPHLIEAKAVSLAPPSPSQTPTNTTHQPSTRALSLLQRPAEIGLREYIHHLIGLGLIQPPPLAEDFLVRYERARFSGVELTEKEFRELVGVFAEVLRGMVGGGLEERLRGESEGDGTESFVSRTTMPSSSGASFESFIPNSSEQGSLRAGSLRLPRQSFTGDNSATPSYAASSSPPPHHRQQQKPTLHSPDTPPPQITRSISAHSLGRFGLSSFLASSSSSSSAVNNNNLQGNTYLSPSHQRREQRQGGSSTDASLPGDDTVADNNPLHQSTTWETVRTPGGGLWVGPPPLEWQKGSGGPFG